MEHRFQARLQVPTGDLLGDAIRDRRDAQRSRATACLRNIDPPHRRSPPNAGVSGLDRRCCSSGCGMRSAAAQC
jgi:hypothetical protein